VVRRQVSEETQRILAGRQAALTSISQHPNWPELVAEAGRKRERIEKIVLAKSLGGVAPVDPIEIAYLKGFVHGVEWFTSVPEVAEAALERFLRTQGVEGVTSG
jgi:hypothetical protein